MHNNNNLHLPMPKIIILALLFTSTLCSSLSHPFWPISITGSTHESRVMKPLGPCQPCQYTLNIENNQMEFRIYSEANKQYVQVYKLKGEQEGSQVVFLGRELRFMGTLDTDPDQKIKISVDIFPQDGLTYNYIVQIFTIGLYIEHTQKIGSYSIPMKSLFYALISILLLPLQKSPLQKSMYETNKRTSLLSLFLYTQTTVTIASITAITAVQFVYYTESLIGKILYYMTFGSCFLLGVVHATFGIAVVQNQMNRYFRSDGLYKFGVMGLGIFVGLIGYPLFLITFQKGIWYFYFSSIGLIIQFVMSYYQKMLPYKTFIILYSVSLLFLAIQTDNYPILNFQELSLFSLILFAVFVAGILGAGAWSLRNVGNMENIADMFEIGSKNSGQERVRGSESTSADDSRKNMQEIKSDIELEQQTGQKQNKI